MSDTWTDYPDAPAPIRPLGSDPLDVVRVTLSRQLRAVLYRAGVVDSPELPLYDRPEQFARAQAPPAPAPARIVERMFGPQKLASETTLMDLAREEVAS